MRKLFLIFIIMLSIVGFYVTGGACTEPGCDGSATSTATVAVQKGAIQNSNTSLTVNTNVFDPTNKQEQFQGQIANNNQIIAPKQTVLFEANPLGLPSQSVPELNFGNGRMYDATRQLPNFAIYGITALKAEYILEVLDIDANVKFKNLYKAVLGNAKKVSKNGNKNIRYQIYCAQAQKTWTTGGNLGGGASGANTSGIGMSGAGSIIPQIGGTKADDLFTIIFVKVAP